MSLGAKLLVGALVLGAAGTAGTYAVTNGGFGIGGNGEGSSENTQTASNQSASAAQEVSSASGDATARGSNSASLVAQPESGPSPQINVGDVPQTTDQISVPENTNIQNKQQTLNSEGDDASLDEGRAQIQLAPVEAPPVTTTDQIATGKESLPQSHEEGGNDPQKAPVQVESGSDANPEKSKGGADGASLTGSNPEVEQQGRAKDPQSPSRSNSAGEGQNQETAPLQSTDTNT